MTTENTVNWRYVRNEIKRRHKVTREREEERAEHRKLSYMSDTERFCYFFENNLKMLCGWFIVIVGGGMIIAGIVMLINWLIMNRA